MEKNNNFDDLNNIDMNELKKNVLNKLETKIAVEEFKIKEEIKDNENNNGNSNNTKSKVKSMRKKNNFLYRVAAVLIGIIFVGNVYTYAAYKENLFSFIVSRIGIIDNYSEKGEDVNLKEQSLGNDLTLQSYAIDNNNLVVTYNLKLEEKQEYFIELLADESSLIIDGEEYHIPKNHSFDFFEISDTEYEIVKSYDIKEGKIADDVKFKTEITLYKDLDGNIEEKLGVWNFEIDLEFKNESMVEGKKYSFENKVVNMYFEEEEKDPNIYYPDYGPMYDTIDILGLEQTNLGTKLTFFANIGVIGDYFIEIVDDKGNVLLENNTERLIANMKSEILFKSVDLNSKITINIDCVDYLDNGEKAIVSEASITLDLAKDLKEFVEKNDYTKTIWKDFSFDIDSKMQENMIEKDNEFDNVLEIGLFEVYSNGANDYLGEITFIESEVKNCDALDFAKIIRLKELAESFGITYERQELHYSFGDKFDILEGDLSEIAIVGKIYINGEEVTEEDLAQNTYRSVTDIEEKEYKGVKVYSFDVDMPEDRDIVYVFNINDTNYCIKATKTLRAKGVVDKLLSSIEIVER